LVPGYARLMNKKCNKT